MLTRWLRAHAVDLEPLSGPGRAARLAPLRPLAQGAHRVLVGESTHFAAQLTPARALLLAWLDGAGFRCMGDELGSADGRWVDRAVTRADPRGFERLVAGGYTGWARGDRDDRPRGVLGANARRISAADHAGRLRQLRATAGTLAALGGWRFFGFDVDQPPSALYPWLEHGPVRGESRDQELERARDPALRAALRFAEAARHAGDAGALNRLMAFREDVMTANVRRVQVPAVLFGHCLHMARDDRRIAAPGLQVTPAGGARCMGTRLCDEDPGGTVVVWVVHGAGQGGGPSPATGVPHLGHRAFAVSLREPGPLDQLARVFGHFELRLAEQADVLVYLPRITAT
jgi:hypothetical protein